MTQAHERGRGRGHHHIVKQGGGSAVYTWTMVVGRVAWAVAGAVVTSAILLNPTEQSFREQVESESKKRTGFIGVCHLIFMTLSSLIPVPYSLPPSTIPLIHALSQRHHYHHATQQVG